MCKDKTHEKMFKKISSDVDETYSLLYSLIYKTKPPTMDHHIWDRFQSIQNMLDQLFTISEEHGLLGAPASCSCDLETHTKMKTEIENALDEIIVILE
jgi:hypothetical protein